ncbi:hypothetical protein [Brevibacillus fulvus]|uniref:Uncharacterized protein n=1 Tax=Brevibacillus fulvus TaxID=1125967 RepID=A0A938XTF1_9BACL|nr:hypothetical protein [Brevibacillus fulvus]MBM7589747.1 hypothetical protein [Brevibacillus fulvus]
MNNQERPTLRPDTSKNGLMKKHQQTSSEQTKRRGRDILDRLGKKQKQMK